MSLADSLTPDPRIVRRSSIDFNDASETSLYRLHLSMVMGLILVPYLSYLATSVYGL